MIRLVGVLLLVATTAWPPSATVLCIVPGGHVAIESGPDRCETPPPAGHDAELGPHAALRHGDTCCAPCTDVPIGARVMGGPARPDDPLHALAEAVGRALALLPAIAGTPEAPASLALDPGRSPGPAPSSILHGTIVLRC
jgi:hypothetical protein